MTAMNAFGRPDGAWLLFDGAFYAADGTVIGHHRKAVANERLRAAIGWNGVLPRETARPVRQWLSRQADSAAALANLSGLVADIEAELATCEFDGHPEGFRLTLAYWDAERGCGRVALIGSNERMGASIGRAPLEVRHISSIFTPRLDPSPWPDDFDPRAGGKRLAELQRQTRDADGTIRVGGAFTALRVHSTGIERFEIMRWRDPIGRKIGERRSWFCWPIAALGGGPSRASLGA
jgi:hypothetical protein